MNNRSVLPKTSNNASTYSQFASPPHTTVNVSMQQPSGSMAQSGISKADLPYRSLAQFGVLSKYIDLSLSFYSIFCFR
jgi:hypothetical protein